MIGAAHFARRLSCVRVAMGHAIATSASDGGGAVTTASTARRRHHVTTTRRRHNTIAAAESARDAHTVRCGVHSSTTSNVDVDGVTSQPLA